MASQSGFFKFFASPRGRQFCFAASVTAASVSFGFHFLPHTVFTSKHREIVASYREGAERPVSETLQKRFEIAQEHLQLSDFEKKWMKPFMVSGFDTYHIGSVKFRYGAFTGIPVNYTYTASDDIDKADIIIRGQSVDWNSRGGKLLEEALVLTEDEQIFGLVRESFQLVNNNVYLNSFYGCGALTMYYLITTALNNNMKLFYRPLSLRLSLYSLVGLFCLGNYALITDYSQVSCDGATDEKLASLGKGFIEAGTRFYDKLLKKNIAIRELTGDSSEYTAMGNENFLIRNKRLPLTVRKTFFDIKLELANRTEESVTAPEESLPKK